MHLTFCPSQQKKTRGHLVCTIRSTYNKLAFTRRYIQINKLTKLWWISLNRSDQLARHPQLGHFSISPNTCLRTIMQVNDQSDQGFDNEAKGWAAATYATNSLEMLCRPNARRYEASRIILFVKILSLSDVSYSYAKIISTKDSLYSPPPSHSYAIMTLIRSFSNWSTDQPSNW